MLGLQIIEARVRNKLSSVYNKLKVYKKVERINAFFDDQPRIYPSNTNSESRNAVDGSPQKSLKWSFEDEESPFRVFSADQEQLRVPPNKNASEEAKRFTFGKSAEANDFIKEFSGGIVAGRPNIELPKNSSYINLIQSIKELHELEKSEKEEEERAR